VEFNQFDYETIRLIWWLFIGIVAIAFALIEGFDFGVCTLLPFVGRTDVERRVIINTVGAAWEGNQVWLILLGGAIFAIWPAVYATLFSGLYAAMLLVLFALFFRPAGFDYRSKLENPSWRNGWDWALFPGRYLASGIIRRAAMLTVGFAASFGIINAMWPEPVCDIDTHGIDQSCDSLRKNDY